MQDMSTRNVVKYLFMVVISMVMIMVMVIRKFYVGKGFC